MFEKLSQLTAEKVAVSKWRTAANLAKMVTRAGKTPSKMTRMQGLDTAKGLLGRAPETYLSNRLQGQWDNLANKFKWTPTRSGRPMVGEQASKAMKYDKAPKVLWRGISQAQELGRGHGGYSKNWAHASPSPYNAAFYAANAKVPSHVTDPVALTKPIGFLSAYKAHPKQRYIHDFGLEEAQLGNRQFGVAKNLKKWDQVHEGLGIPKSMSRQQIFTDPNKYNIRSDLYETAIRPKKNPLLRTFGIRRSPYDPANPPANPYRFGFETTPNTPYLQKAVTNLTKQQMKPLVKGTDPMGLNAPKPPS